MAVKAKQIQWELLDAPWAAGLHSPRQMAADYTAQTGDRISHEGIRKHYEALCIPRDLSAKIRAKAQELVDTQLTNIEKGVDNRLHPVKEREVIEVAARNQADLILTHRKDIPRYRRLAQALLVEIELQTGSQELFAQLAELLHAPDERGVDKLNEIYRKVIGSPQRIDSLKKLAETYKILIGLERQAFGLSDNFNGEADKPPAAPELSPNDAARRIAFILTSATKGK